jgi:hypothetical protein
MKFYREINYGFDFWCKIYDNKLNAIYLDYSIVRFFKNGRLHNSKNAAYISDGYQAFYLNDKDYGDHYTKESWRKFIKMQAFL